MPYKIYHYQEPGFDLVAKTHDSYIKDNEFEIHKVEKILCNINRGLKKAVMLKCVLDCEAIRKPLNGK